MKERSFVVYKHTSPSNKVYIGITSLNPNHRWNEGRGYKTQKLFYRAIKKYGWNNFEHEIMFSDMSEKEAKLMEQCLIALYDSTNQNKGYNITFGGEGANGYKLTEEVKKKISEAQKGKKVSNETRKKQSESIKNYIENNPQYVENLKKKMLGRKLTEKTKKKISEAHKGNKNYWYGKHLPIEMRMKMSETHKGKKMSDEAIKKMSEAQKGKKLSDEHKRKISESHKGEKHWNYGKIASKETRKKQSESHKGKIPWNKGKKMPNIQGNKHFASKKVICLSTKKVFNCLSEAAKFYGIKSSSNIGACCRGERNYCRKLSDGTPLKWMYYEDYLKLNNKNEIVK